MINFTDFTASRLAKAVQILNDFTSNNPYVFVLNIETLPSYITPQGDQYQGLRVWYADTSSMVVDNPEPTTV